MKKTLLTTALFGLLVAGSMSTWAAPGEGHFLADRHVGRGVACASCHGDKAPTAGAKVPMKACVACHGEIEKVAERTKDVTPNPHHNHLVGISCLECHQGHQTSKNVCATCHQVKFKVP